MALKASGRTERGVLQQFLEILVPLLETKPTGPIEVWIREKKATGFTCVVVYADKFTHEFDLVSQTLAAAQEEVTRRLMPVGYQPAGRWSPVETSRIFKLGEPRRGKPVPRRRVLNTAREWGM